MERIRERLEGYAEARARAILRFHSGSDGTLELERVDDEFEDIAGGDALHRAGKELATATGEASRDAWRRLGALLERAVLAASTASLTRRLGEREGAATLAIDGEERALLAWRARLGAEPDRDRRRRIEESLERGERDLEPLREELWREQGEALRARGHASARAQAEAALPGLDLAHAAAQAESFLAHTDDLHRDSLGPALTALGVRDGGPSDVARILRLEMHAESFRTRDAKDNLAFTLEGLDRDAEHLPGVAFDLARRPGKDPRPAVFAVLVPGETVVSLVPRGGFADHAAMLATAGRALPLAYTSPALPVERRRGGDPALAAAWGDLVLSRMADPAWIATGPAARAGESFAADLRFRRLTEAREIAARTLFEDALHALPAGADPKPLAELHAELASRASGVRHQPTGYLLGATARPRAAFALRGCFLAAALAEHLRERFGQRFFRERAAFAFLKELWNTGSTYDADRVAVELGLGPIGPERLLEELLR